MGAGGLIAGAKIQHFGKSNAIFLKKLIFKSNRPHPPIKQQIPQIRHVKTIALD